MSARGWHISFDERATSNPWIASHQADHITVFAEDETRLGLEIRHEQLRRSFDARRNANGSR